ncbi:MAG: type II secretion system minor pseudopilin GspK [Cytophaga sp.]|nr:type II secretion system minor pseudopilin GspK [Undibacterium sp.]
MNKNHQSGVAVVTALLLTTLAITIVASLFWQQQVQVRSIENQRFQLQKKWVLRGALDWARLILREDLRTSRDKVDHLGEPWAVTLGETHLDQYVENGKSDTDDSEASLSGQITDAQSRFNLNNLASAGVPNLSEIAMFSRLLTNLRMDSTLAKSVAAMIASTQNKTDVAGVGTGAGSEVPAPSTGVSSGTALPGSATTVDDNAKSMSIELNPEVQFLRFSQIDDLLAVTGFTPEMVVRLKEYVAVLPFKTSVNLNTTSKEVLAARLDISPTDAALIVAGRDRAYFYGVVDFKARFPGKLGSHENEISFFTNYFFVNGKVKLSRSALEINALIERTDVATKVLWVREN